jgi:predicted nucleotidyltransferase component of viral defense system
VARAQIEHDHVVSHVLAALAPLTDQVVFYGGTALSRTLLDGLRLSEDIDLLSVGPRARVAAWLDELLQRSLERGFGRITAVPRLTEVRTDTQACVYTIGSVSLRIQLIDGRDYARWPTRVTRISQRYRGIAATHLTTFTSAGFVGAKTDAWCDRTRNAPRDLYDLWALAEAGHIDSDAALVYRRHGATGHYPRRWMFPEQPPTDTEWNDALSHQCNPLVDPTEAYATVVGAWTTAVDEAERIAVTGRARTTCLTEPAVGPETM